MSKTWRNNNIDAAYEDGFSSNSSFNDTSIKPNSTEKWLEAIYNEICLVREKLETKEKQHETCNEEWKKSIILPFLFPKFRCVIRPTVYKNSTGYRLCVKDKVDITAPTLLALREAYRNEMNADYERWQKEL